MRKMIHKIILLPGIVFFGAFWLWSLITLIRALLGKLPVGVDNPIVLYSYLGISFVLLPFGIRSMFRKLLSLDPAPVSEWPVPTKSEPPSEDEDPRGWYSIIEDAGYADEISYEEYAKEKSLDTVLFNHKKTFTLDSKDDAVEELLAGLSQQYPQFTHSYQKAPGSSHLPGERRDEKWYYKYKGMICGEELDIETDFSHFVPDILNPILARKMGFQLLFAFPGSDSYEFIIVPNERVEKVKANPCYWDYPLVEHWYGYTAAVPTSGIKKDDVEVNSIK